MPAPGQKPFERPLSSSVEDGDVLLISAEAPTALILTPEAALETARLLQAAGVSALEQRKYRRADPNSGRITRPGEPSA